jgi:2-polyprenyl-3-methyl-5-hydroxy-6-metoxy-1,4-benzoquinol methylase
MPQICSLTNSPLFSYIKVEDHFLSHETFSLLRNEDESLLTTYPVPENLGSYYESKDYISHNTQARGIIPLLYAFAQRISLRSKKRLIKKYSTLPKTLLDYGCGAGVFLDYMKSNRWDAVGVEPNSSARTTSILNSGAPVFSLEEFEPMTKRYSVITLWHVLEHIPNYNEVLLILKNRLEDNGILIVAVPNFKSWDAAYYKSYWAAYDVPRHLFHWSRKGIDYLAKKNGLKLIASKGMWLDAYYVSILSEKYKGAKWPILSGIFFGAWSNARAIFTGETSSVIYILKKA